MRLVGYYFKAIGFIDMQLIWPQLNQIFYLKPCQFNNCQKLKNSPPSTSTLKLTVAQAVAP